MKMTKNTLRYIKDVLQQRKRLLKIGISDGMGKAACTKELFQLNTALKELKEKN